MGCCLGEECPELNLGLLASPLERPQQGSELPESGLPEPEPPEQPERPQQGSEPPGLEPRSLALPALPEPALQKLQRVRRR